MKLINADAIIAALESFSDLRNGNTRFLSGIETAKEIATRLPEAVVRCKDCRYYEKNGLWCCRLGFVGAFDKNNYCSRGERRTDETD